MGTRDVRATIVLGMLIPIVATFLAAAQEKKPEAAEHCLRFSGRDNVELTSTKGLLDLNGTFTIEAWVRWDPDYIGRHSLAGDEAWPGMNKELPVPKDCGWILRTTALEESNKRGLDFTISGSAGNQTDWTSIITPLRKDSETKAWQHIAVCKTVASISIYWNGKLAIKRSCQGIRFNSSPSNTYLGVRKFGFEDRKFHGDFRAFHISKKVRYTRNFEPEEAFKLDDATLLLLDFRPVDEKKIGDINGNKHDGIIVGPKWIDLAGDK